MLVYQRITKRVSFVRWLSEDDFNYYDVKNKNKYTNTHPEGLLSTSDQLVAAAVTYTTENKRKRRISIPSVGSEPAIQAVKQLLTYALDRTATRIGTLHTYDKGTDIDIHNFTKRMPEIDAEIAVSISDNE